LYYLEIIYDLQDFQKTNEKANRSIYSLTGSSGRTIGQAIAIVNTSGESEAKKVIILKEVGILFPKKPSDMGLSLKILLKGS
tara:strand:+ start:146 stop:391 length:246 start_codon:yes stop_codon:yes gene_type:complete